MSISYEEIDIRYKNNKLPRKVPFRITLSGAGVPLGDNLTTAPSGRERGDIALMRNKLWHIQMLRGAYLLIGDRHTQIGT